MPKLKDQYVRVGLFFIITSPILKQKVFMVVVGIHTGHDAALSVVKDGRLIGAVSMERFSKIKKDEFISWDNFVRFLESFKLKLDDIDYFAFGYWNQGLIPFMSIYSPVGEKYPLSQFSRTGLEAPLLNHLNKEDYHIHFKVEYDTKKGYTLPPMIDRVRPPYNNSEISDRNSYPLNVEVYGYERLIPGYFVDHHISHAASTFYTSNYENAVMFTADASMHEHKSCSGFFYGRDKTMNIFREPGYTYGNFYDVATEYLGLGPGTTKAGTLMGLSSFGEVSKNARDNWEEWTKPQWLRGGIDDVTWCDWVFLQMSGKFPFVGTLRDEIKRKDPGSHLFTREYQKVYESHESDSKEVMDIAADVQYVAERSLVKNASDLFKESKGIGDDNLCLAGGTMLNCNANYKIKRESGFENVHLFPACGDDGVSTGAALFVSHNLLGYERVLYSNKELMYLGPEYDYYPKGPYLARDLNVDELAKHIADGKIVCWYQGRSEFGPRALGNRSFITDPRNKEMKDILNSRVKHREWFRPFAPVVLNEHKEEWFDMDFESPFMLFTVPCKKPQEIPSAVHIDNTSRVQTLRREDNPIFYGLIESFYELTGVPVVLNTSLNIKGRPIVETPDDAMELFNEADADILVINDVMYFKD